MANPLIGLAVYAIPETVSLIDTVVDAQNETQFFNEYINRMKSVAENNSKVDRLLQGIARGGNVTGSSAPDALEAAVRNRPNSGWHVAGKAIGVLGRDLLIAATGGKIIGGAVPALKTTSAIDTGFMTSVPIVHTINDSMTKYGEGYDVADSIIHGGSTGAAMMMSGGVFFKGLPKAIGFLKTRKIFNAPIPGMQMATSTMRKMQAGRMTQNVIEWGGWGASEHIMTEAIRSGLSDRYDFNVDWKATGEGAVMWGTIGTLMHTPTMARELAKLGSRPFKKLRSVANRTGSIGVRAKLTGDAALKVADEMHGITTPSRYRLTKQADVLYDMVKKHGAEGAKQRLINERELQKSLQITNPFRRGVTIDILDDMVRNVDTKSRKAFHSQYADEVVKKKERFFQFHNTDHIDGVLSDFPGISVSDAEKSLLKKYNNAMLDIMDNGSEQAAESAKFVRENTADIERFRRRIKKAADSFDFGFSVSTDVTIPGRLESTSNEVVEAYKRYIHEYAGRRGVVSEEMKASFDNFITTAMQKNGNTSLKFGDLVDATNAFKKYAAENSQTYQKQMSMLRKYGSLREVQ